MNTARGIPAIRTILGGLALIVCVLPGTTAFGDMVTIGSLEVFYDGAASGESDWLAAIATAAPSAVFSGENFNDDPLSPSNGLGTGPHSFGGTGNNEFTMTLNDVGSGGSMTGIINPGEHDGSNALEIRLVDDSSDIVIIPPDILIILGEGAESIDFQFAETQIAWSAEFRSATTHDGLQINVNGIQIDLHDFYPDTSLSDGDGFLGILDTSGISALTFVTDQQAEPSAIFENLEMDDVQYAKAGSTVPIPEPGAVGLVAVGIAAVGVVMRRRRR